MKSSNQSSTLLVGKMVNLTKEEMWTYGTSGTLVNLRPHEVVVERGKRVPAPEDKTSYIMEMEDALQMVECNPEYARRIIIPIYHGRGHEGQKIYNFSTPSGMNVRLITDEMGYHGSIIRDRSSSFYARAASLRVANA